jgi:superfamily II DNA or RNA helicase
MQQLRPYQQEAVQAIFGKLEEHHSTLLVMATGTGKTSVFTDVIRRVQPGRALVLCHRSELIYQAAKRIESVGIETSIEMGEHVASASLWNQTPVIVSTVQTQIAGASEGRMTRFDPFSFNLVVIDEAHHATSASFRRVVDYYKQNPELRILGVTATPDRADEEALGQVFDSVAFEYEILDAINDGFLVPVEQQMVEIEGLDFSHIRTTAGDLNGADLASVMEAEKNLHGIVAATLDIIGQRRTIVFAVTVKQAEMYAEIFNRHRPGMADWVCGKTPKDQRHEKLRKFGTGQTQVMINVGILTEGYDNPATEVIVQARPTKSRSLYTQMIGRGTRALPGIVDSYDTPETRRAAIAASTKAACLVIDFAGNAGKHKLMTMADVLGGKVSEMAVERVKVKASKTAFNVMEALEEEELKLRREEEERKRCDAARRAHLTARATYSAQEISPFDIFQLTPERERGWDANRRLTDKQANILRKAGIDPTKVPYTQAKQLIGELFRRWDGGLCTLKQAKLLQKHGYETKDLKMSEASQLIDALAKNGWRRPVDSPPSEMGMAF